MGAWGHHSQSSEVWRQHAELQLTAQLQCCARRLGSTLATLESMAGNSSRVEPLDSHRLNSVMLLCVITEFG
jgi:hypothetical protein